ncbi:MAG: ATP-binding protein [Verrucomicrobia bacterium]|nr:ATP-binding protein [Verrucomicrobiota bacterium]MDA1088519.1 ATP-binding protein [Verrucomicrobiota bacterium]
MNKETLKGVLRQFSEGDLPRFRRRELRLPAESGKVVCLTGARRTGKTFLMFQTMHDLIEQGVSPDQIVYLNFEDDRLYPVANDELDLILRAHQEMFPDVAQKKRFVFFDEIQNLSGWERFVRRICDTENVSVFLTGSSSSLLRKDMSTAMRGRSITFEVFPLSFAEFLAFREIDYVAYSAASEARIVNAFQEYLDWGGFPEVVLAEEPLKLMILQEYAGLMLHRDLIERFSIRNERAIRLLLKFCAEHTGSLVSINKLFKDFTSQGVKIGKATLYDYMAMLEASFIVFACPKYDPSTRRQTQAPQKVHMLDPGLTRAYRARPQRDVGHRFETLIYLHIRRRTQDICYYRNGFELDMCWGEGEHFVNAAWDITERETAARELKALDAGLNLWPQANGRLVYGVGAKLPPSHKPFMVEGWRYLLHGETDQD